MSDYFEIKREILRSRMNIVFVDPIVGILVKIRFTPNIVTILGFIIVSISAYFAAIGYFRTAGILVAFSGFLDIYDGALARKLNLESPRGALLDSTLDRLGEAIILLGIIYFYTLDQNLNIVMMASISMVFSLMISYLRARIEGLGYNSKSGIFTRPERVFIVSTGLILFNPFITIVVLTIATTIGLIHRFVIFWKMMRG